MRKQTPIGPSPWRHWFVLITMLLGLSLLAVRGIYLQYVTTDYLQKQGNARYLRTVTIPPSRGQVTDRHGQVLAVSTPVDSVWAHPETLLGAEEKWAPLAKAMSIKTSSVAKGLNKYENKEYMYLRRHLPPAVAEKVLELGVPGVSLTREYKRYYPAGAIAGHLLGFTNVDNQGQEGIELAFNEHLSGTPGLKRVLKDRVGHIVETVDRVRAVEDGKDLALSVDSRLQYLVFRHLKAAVEEHKAKGGTSVILDSRTGELLAMANEPSFNPNNRANFRSSHFRNRAVTDVMEPGSTIKPFTIAMALESGRYLPNTTVQTAPGWLRVGRNTIKDVHDYGLLTVNRVVAKSSNVGTTKIAMSFPARRLYETLADFGFGQSTKIGLPGEVSGVLANRKKWRPIEHATLAFGYGLNATPLQLARAYTALANDGRLMPVSMLKKQTPVVGEQIIEPKYVESILNMLEMATSDDGTAKQAQVAQYRVAGKTGTVHKLSGKGYAEKIYQSLFVGIAPVSSPRFIMVVVVDEPNAGKHYGGQVAAPVFAKVMAGALRLYNVPPDAPMQPEPDAAEQKTAGFNKSTSAGHKREA